MSDVIPVQRQKLIHGIRQRLGVNLVAQIAGEITGAVSAASANETLDFFLKKLGASAFFLFPWDQNQQGIVRETKGYAVLPPLINASSAMF